MRTAAAAILQFAIGLAYPVAIFFALERWSPRQIGFVVAGLALLRLFAVSEDTRKRFLKDIAPLALTVASLVAATIAWDDPRGLLLLPVMVNLGLLIGFANTLRGETPMIERFARLQVEELSEEEVAYCRRVTLVWCAFFLGNGGIALVLAIAESIELWTLYTGLVSYLLIGTLFGVEYVYRHWRFRRYVGAVTDPFLSRLFPPRQVTESPREAGTDPPCSDETFSVADDAPWWPDHFPAHPILPGIIQLRWAIEAMRREESVVSSVDRLRFNRPIRPHDELILTLDPDEERGTAFEYTRSGQVVSSGRVRFAQVIPPIDETFDPRAARFEAPSISELLPHRGDMIWLARVDGHDANRTRCVVDLHHSARHLEAPSRRGELGAWASIEWMAQCISAHDTLHRLDLQRGDPEPRIGLLLGTRALHLHRGTIDVDEPCFVEVEHVWGGDESLAVFDAVVFDREHRIIARARLSCAIPDEEKLATLLG